eukprot:m.4954 g.4954  ORF g.4954 m.4954 type:complete len:110 (-) comp3145_c0_seq1:1199-1528(-)
MLCLSLVVCVLNTSESLFILLVNEYFRLCCVFRISTAAIVCITLQNQSTSAHKEALCTVTWVKGMVREREKLKYGCPCPHFELTRTQVLLSLSEKNQAEFANQMEPMKP